MCDHPNREAAMTVVRPKTADQSGVWCDPCLSPLVKALNDGGLATIASCCGHGKRPGNVMLADGRLLGIYTVAECTDSRGHIGPPAAGEPA